MAELAQVIVDVPTMQTDQPYTYAIPKRLESQIQVGMRVIVPFGRGKREVQGFVVGIDQPTEYDGTLKSIIGLMDLVPVVNTELLQLSRWMADQTYAFWISCLYTMLPNALKAKSHRVVRIVDEVDEQTALDLFQGADELDFERYQNDPQIVSQLLKLKRQGKVSFEYQVEDRARVKKEIAIQPLMSFEQYEDERVGVRANAHAQQRLLSYLQQIDGQKVKLKQAEQQSGLKAGTFNVGEKRGWLKKIAVETYRTPAGMIPDDQHLDSPLKLNPDPVSYTHLRAHETR